MTNTPTFDTYSTLEQAFTFFNDKLFGGRLPNTILTMQRHRGAYGYFAPKRFYDRDSEAKERLHEIALNPSHLAERSRKDALSTLVHEMVHLEQQAFGKPGRGGYHNKEWGDWMRRIGLTPRSLNGKNGTGTKVTHDIDTGGLFDCACDEFLTKHAPLALPYVEDPIYTAGRAAKLKVKKASKTKYTCEDCGLNAWGKPGIRLTCTDCDCPMEAEEQDE